MQPGRKGRHNYLGSPRLRLVPSAAVGPGPVFSLKCGVWAVDSRAGAVTTRKVCGATPAVFRSLARGLCTTLGASSMTPTHTSKSVTFILRRQLPSPLVSWLAQSMLLIASLSSASFGWASSGMQDLGTLRKWAKSSRAWPWYIYQQLCLYDRTSYQDQLNMDRTERLAIPKKEPILPCKQPHSLSRQATGV